MKRGTIGVANFDVLRDHRLQDSPKITYFHLCEMATKSGLVVVNIAELARRQGCDRRSISRNVKALAETAHIVKSHRQRRDGGTSASLYQVYTLATDAADEFDPEMPDFGPYSIEGSNVGANTAPMTPVSLGQENLTLGLLSPIVLTRTGARDRAGARAGLESQDSFLHHPNQNLSSAAALTDSRPGSGGGGGNRIFEDWEPTARCRTYFGKLQKLAATGGALERETAKFVAHSMHVQARDGALHKAIEGLFMDWLDKAEAKAAPPPPPPLVARADGAAPQPGESGEEHPLWPLVRGRVDASAFRTWLGKLVLAPDEDGEAVLVAPTTFMRDHCRKEFGDLLRVQLGRRIRWDVAAPAARTA